MKTRILIGWLWLAVTVCSAQSKPAFPLKTSENGRYFVDQTGKPFFYHADTGWQLFARLTLPEAREYLTLRKQHGFNTIQVHISMNPDSVNRAGQKALIDYDFSKPNEPYFAHVERVIQVADSLGLLLTISPFWIGCCREAHGVEAKHEVYKLSGPAKCRQMGEYLGRRFGKYKNILWLMGGDNDPRSIRAEIVAMAEGLHAPAPQQLQTYHATPPHSSTDLFQYAPWLGFSMIYTYWREKPNEWSDGQQMPHVYEAALREYNKSDRMPFVLGESQYEGDGVRYGNDIGTPQQVRRQAYWTMLCGGAGHAYGHDGWDFPKQWRTIINYPGGSQHMKHVRTLFESLPWHTLVPDQKHTVIVNDYGEFMKADYVAAAVTADKTTLVAYLPQPGRPVVDLSQLKGPNLTVRWYDPRTGQFGKEQKMPAQGVKRLVSPPQNDWVLVVQSGQ
ncbi:glycoside hydrolase family 140 protein [Spirosoma montaniterrae]|nr:glycoside hydrolase family 140 protein [Spirosoma montaniterrae]